MQLLRLLCYFLLVTCYLLGYATPMAATAATPDGRIRKVIAHMLRLAEEDLLKLGDGGVMHGSLTRWKLREIPLGPNPMHHHGNDPQKKPQTP